MTQQQYNFHNIYTRFDDQFTPPLPSHVDIHNKPGYDPTELFFFGHGVVKGTHGRKCEVAYAEA